jgi:5'-phosphate synthase pdxT subunit
MAENKVIAPDFPSNPTAPAGILAFQGAYALHAKVCEKLGMAVLEVRTSEDLESCSHLMIPGGESTTFLRLLEYHDLSDSLRRHAAMGKPILATCAGLILLAKQVASPPQKSMGLLDITVERNAYGRQVDSFETELEIPVLGTDAFHGVFIRAPIIESVGKGVEVLASHSGNPVFVRQGNIFATTFHPELADDTRLHRYFLSAAAETPRC